MKTLSASLAFRGGNPQGMRSFDASFCVKLYQLMNKQSRDRWFEAPWHSFDVTVMWLTIRPTNGCSRFAYDAKKYDTD